MKKTLALACLIAGGAGSLAYAHGGGAGGDGDGPRGLLERVDANGDNKLTLAEMKTSAKALFDAADTDHDGRVTKQEQSAFQQQMRAKFEASHGTRMAERFAKQDSNGDGRLSRKEAAGMPDERFARIDSDKDGQLSKAELEAARATMKDAMKRHHGEPGEHGGNPLERADQNQDGAIDRAEMESEVQRHFAHMDKDGNGTLEVPTTPRVQAPRPDVERRCAARNEHTRRRDRRRASGFLG
jgi:Ca2+-binding EF-hand superfamily protein